MKQDHDSNVDKAHYENSFRLDLETSTILGEVVHP